MISLRNVKKKYNYGNQETIILRNQTLDIHENDSLAITGPSGRGKSTILKLIAGLEPPTSGKILFKNQDIYKLNDESRAKIRRENFGFIFQSFRLFSQLTVLENITLACEISNIKHPKKIAESWLNEVNLIKQKNQKPDTLSGGEQQRVAIARALSTNPKIILADEPTGNLDQNNSNKIKHLLLHCMKLSKATLILVTHDEKLAKICKVQYKLEDYNLKMNE